MNDLTKTLLKGFLCNQLASYVGEVFQDETAGVISAHNGVGSVIFNFKEEKIYMDWGKGLLEIDFPDHNHSEMFVFVIQDFCGRVILSLTTDKKQALVDLHEFMVKYSIDQLTVGVEDMALQIRRGETIEENQFALRKLVCGCHVAKILGEIDAQEANNTQSSDAGLLH